MSLPLADVRTYAGKALPTAADSDEVAEWVGRLVRRLGGRVQSAIEGDRVVVRWTPAERRRSGPDEGVEWLRAGQHHEAVVVLELLLDVEPRNEVILYNLGMAHSDLGKLARAEDLLRRCLDIHPSHTNARVALGVALLRQGRVDDAVPVLERAVADAKDNPWAHRNLAGALHRQGNIEGALVHLRASVELNPHDARGWGGLGQALEQVGELHEADEAYKRAIELSGFGDVADAAEKGRSRIAQAAFRANGVGEERPDAVMYCLGALETFAQMTPAEIQAVGLEIALLGTKGLNVNNPDEKCRLESLPGEFTGLHLVSLMYVAFKTIAPEQDIGFDLSKEYATALALRGEGTRRQAPGAT